jgi:uncharacterized LabA/DUF88 family protein
MKKSSKEPFVHNVVKRGTTKMSDKKPKAAIFVDGANFHLMSRSLDITVDYRKLLQYFEGDYNLLRAFYYTVLGDEGEFSPLKPLTDWLEYNGYTMVTKTLPPGRDYSFSNQSSKTCMDVNITLDVMEMANFVDSIILFTGDGDFIPLIRAVQRRGVKVCVVGTVQSKNSVTSDELRRKADVFINLADLSSHLQRTDKSSRSTYDDFDETVMERLRDQS